jgi:cytochrome c-type biogenesis protein CcsB
MTPRMLVTSVAAGALAVLAIMAVWYRHASSRPPVPEHSSFVQDVDLTPLGGVAVHENGRLKSFDSFASTMMHYVAGPHEVEGKADAFTYLDMIFRPAGYEGVDAIYVKNKPMRAEIASALKRSLAETLPQRLSGQGLSELEIAEQARHVQDQMARRMADFVDTGMISTTMLMDPEVQALLDRKQRDLIRTAKAADQIRTAISVSDPRVLRQNLRIVPPPGGGFDDPWLTIDEYAFGTGGASADPERRREIAMAWTEMAEGWQGEDAERVNSAAARLAGLLPSVNPDVYPQQKRLSAESWYFSAGNMTWVWLIYLLSVIFLVMSIAYRWGTARWIGLGVFLLAFALHTFALGLRWYVSGRWPNSNMFEAVTTSVWFGGCLALIMEVLVRRTPMRNVFALGSAVASMVALMCVHFLPVDLNPNIMNRMPVLHDVWLYIHTNVIIFSYCLITMAAVSALVYLVYRVGGGGADYVRVGGAGALILKKPSGEKYLTEGKASAGQVLDGATMVLMELAFVMLWAGTVMGAIWADHSWGRPWGWDPKEVFALNTFVILALLVHTRLKVRDKGLWTALLAIAGFAVMLFNWIVINFHIVGLHSYA